MKKSDGRAADLLSGEEVMLLQDLPPTPTSSQSQGELEVSSPTKKTANQKRDAAQNVEHEVRLLQAVKVPAGYQKLVRGRTNVDTDGRILLFTPEELEESLQMADGVVEMGNDCFMMLIVQNHGTEKLHLKKGVRLGTVNVLTTSGGGDNVRLRGSGDSVVSVAHNNMVGVTTPGYRSAEELASGPMNVDQTTGTGEGAMAKPVSAPRVPVQSISSGGDVTSSAQMQCLQESSKKDCRGVDIFSQIEMDLSHVTEGEQRSLKLILASYADVFALNPSELGTTQLVTHSIDTGTHQPIKQQVR